MNFGRFLGLRSHVQWGDGGEDRISRQKFPSGPQQGQARLPEVLVGAVDQRVEATVQVWHHRRQCPQPIRRRRKVHPAQQNQLVKKQRPSGFYKTVASVTGCRRGSLEYLRHHEGRVAQHVGGHQQGRHGRQVGILLPAANKAKNKQKKIANSSRTSHWWVLSPAVNITHHSTRTKKHPEHQTNLQIDLKTYLTHTHTLTYVVHHPNSSVMSEDVVGRRGWSWSTCLNHRCVLKTTCWTGNMAVQLHWAATWDTAAQKTFFLHCRTRWPLTCTSCKVFSHRLLFFLKSIIRSRKSL